MAVLDSVNLSARNYRVWVCKPSESDSAGLEVTAACSGDGEGYFSAVDQAIDEGGIFSTSGKLVLIPTDEIDCEWNPWIDTTGRWQIGNRVIIKVYDSGADDLVLHPRSGLFILSDPEPPHPDSYKLEIELGDAFSLNDFRTPDDDKSGIEFGTGTERGVIVDNLLDASGVPFTGSIPKYPLTYPIPKVQRSYTEQAGAVAIGGIVGLWQKNDGVVSPRVLNINPAKRLFKQTVGGINGDDADGFVPLQGQERPVSIAKAVGTGYEVTTLNDSGSTIFEEFAPASAIDEEGSDAIVLAGKGTEQWTWSGNRFTRRRRVERARGLLLPNSFFEEIGRPPEGSPYGLRFAEESEENKYYESADEGRLIKETFEAKAPRGVLFQNYYRNNPPRPQDQPAWFAPDVSEDRRTEYDYISGGQTRRIAITKLEPRGKIAGAANNWSTNPNLVGLSPSEINVTTWEEKNKEEWEKHELVQQSGQVPSGNIGSYLALVTTLDQKTRSRGGEAQPPAADRRPPTFNREEKPIEGEAEFGDISGGEFSPREHTYQFDYLVSQEQADELALVFGTIRKARHQGFRVVSAMIPEVFDYVPFSRIDVEWDGYVHIGISNIVTWTLKADQSAVIFDCMRIGRLTLPNEDTYPENPDEDPEAVTEQDIVPVHVPRIRMRGGIGIGGDIAVFGYGKGLTETATFPGGIGIGGSVTDGFPGGIGIGGEFFSEAPITGTLVGTCFSGNEVGSEIWVYYSATTPPSNLATLSRTVYSEGVNYDSISIPLVLTTLLQTNGNGFYVLMGYQPNSNPSDPWDGFVYFNEVTNSGATFTQQFGAYEDTVNMGGSSPRNGILIEVTDANQIMTFDFQFTFD